VFRFYLSFGGCDYLFGDSWAIWNVVVCYVLLGLSLSCLLAHFNFVINFLFLVMLWCFFYEYAGELHIIGNRRRDSTVQEAVAGNRPQKTYYTRIKQPKAEAPARTQSPTRSLTDPTISTADADSSRKHLALRSFHKTHETRVTTESPPFRSDTGPSSLANSHQSRIEATRN